MSAHAVSNVESITPPLISPLHANLRKQIDEAMAARRYDKVGPLMLLIAKHKMATHADCQFTEETPIDVQPLLRDVWLTIYAYEETLRLKNNGKLYKAYHTRSSLAKHGVVHLVRYTIENAPPNDGSSNGFNALFGYGLGNLTFENLVIKHSQHFNSHTVGRAAIRLREQGVI